MAILHEPPRIRLETETKIAIQKLRCTMGFVVRQSDHPHHGWRSKPMRPAAGGKTELRGFGPRNCAAVFATREDAQREIDAIQQRDPACLSLRFNRSNPGRLLEFWIKALGCRQDANREFQTFSGTSQKTTDKRGFGDCGKAVRFLPGRFTCRIPICFRELGRRAVRPSAMPHLTAAKFE
jgi:hypothetical protein